MNVRVHGDDSAAGSKVELTVTHEGSKTPSTVVVTRQKYALVPVQSKLCGPAAGTGKKVEYIRLTTFNTLSGAKVKEAVKDGQVSGSTHINFKKERFEPPPSYSFRLTRVTGTPPMCEQLWSTRARGSGQALSRAEK